MKQKYNNETEVSLVRSMDDTNQKQVSFKIDMDDANQKQVSFKIDMSKFLVVGWPLFSWSFFISSFSIP